MRVSRLLLIGTLLLLPVGCASSHPSGTGPGFITTGDSANRMAEVSARVALSEAAEGVPPEQAVEVATQAARDDYDVTGPIVTLPEKLVGALPSWAQLLLAIGQGIGEHPAESAAVAAALWALRKNGREGLAKTAQAMNPLDGTGRIAPVEATQGLLQAILGKGIFHPETPVGAEVRGLAPPPPGPGDPPAAAAAVA